MSSFLSSQGMVLATAMAVSGTFILLTLRLQKSIPTFQFPVDQISPSPQILRPCLSSDGKRREKKKKKKKKVHFAKDVVDPTGYSEEFRRQHGLSTSCSSKFKKIGHVDVNINNSNDHNSGGDKVRTMPANRVALYHGILRDRGVQRLAYSY